LRPIVVAFEATTSAGVHQPVDDGRGHDVIAEDLVPAAERLVGVTISLACS
jgi:hypothetical protein